MSRSNGNPLLLPLLVLAFASGVGSGFIVGRSQAVHGIDIASPTEVFDAMAERVGLSPEQKAKCQEIQSRQHPRAVKLKASIADELAAIRSDMRSQMSALMSEEQRARFQDFYSRRDQQRAVQEK